MNTTPLPPTPADLRAGELLAELVRRGWVFSPGKLADSGEALALLGIRFWPGGWSDAIGFSTPTDAYGWRSCPDDPPGITWDMAGGVVEVAAELLNLPAPDAPNAPRLVKAPAPRLVLPRRAS